MGMKAIWFLRFWIDEIREDRRLGIRTRGRDDSYSDPDKHPYEPTPYAVLEKLAAAEYIGEENTLIDYGCGKGRTVIFFHKRTGCSAIGIECEKRFLEAALRNQEAAGAPRECVLHEGRAEDCDIPPQADRLFFFNPFSAELLHEVMGKIRASCEAAPREILLFFYYPSRRYIAYLQTVRELTLLEEIDCSEFFYEEDEREKIMVFRFR